MLLGIALTTCGLQSAYAGTYANITQAGANIGVNTDASLTLNGPAVNNGQSVNSFRSDPTYSPRTEQILSYDWVWTPAGTLAADPAPLMDVSIAYNVTGGPIKALKTGQARAVASVETYADYTTRSGGWIDSADTAANNNNVTLNVPGNKSALIGQGTASRYGSLRIVDGDTLRFTNTVTAASQSALTAYHGGTAQTQFNNVNIQTTTLSIQ